MLSLIAPVNVCCFWAAIARPAIIKIALHNNPAFLMTTLLED
jgi:hypothetical protein